MKFTVKPLKMKQGAKEIDFQGMELELTLEEIAIHFDHLQDMQDCFDRFIKKSLEALKEAEKVQAEHHAQQMEYLRQSDANDAAYMQRRNEHDTAYHAMEIERENLRQQHWIEKYGKEETED